MESNKQYRFKNNPKEKEFHDKFIKMFRESKRSETMLSGIVFGWKSQGQNIPNQQLTQQEEDVCVNLIQWLGSPVGQGFLADCGFVQDIKKRRFL